MACFLTWFLGRGGNSFFTLQWNTIKIICKNITSLSWMAIKIKLLGYRILCFSVMLVVAVLRNQCKQVFRKKKQYDRSYSDNENCTFTRWKLHIYQMKTLDSAKKNGEEFNTCVDEIKWFLLASLLAGTVFRKGGSTRFLLCKAGSMDVAAAT